VTDERGRGGEPESEEPVGVTTAEKEPAPGAGAEPASGTAPSTETDRGTVISGDVATAATGNKPRAPIRSVATPRRARVVIKKLGPWSVLKLSLLFYFCVMVVFLLALVILYLIMTALGTLDAGVKLLSEVGLVDAGFKIHGGWLLVRVFAGGVALVVLWSIVNVFAVFLYNLIADVIGGIEVTLAERR
jgi:Transmembrane domain of unknown function (DUF3566)